MLQGFLKKVKGVETVCQLGSRVLKSRPPTRTDTRKTEHQVHMEMNQLLLKLDASLGPVLIIGEGKRSIPVSTGVFTLAWRQNSIPQINTTLRGGRTRKDCILAFGVRIASP